MSENQYAIIPECNNEYATVLCYALIIGKGETTSQTIKALRWIFTKYYSESIFVMGKHKNTQSTYVTITLDWSWWWVPLLLDTFVNPLLLYSEWILKLSRIGHLVDFINSISWLWNLSIVLWNWNERSLGSLTWLEVDLTERRT